MQCGQSAGVEVSGPGRGIMPSRGAGGDGIFTAIGQQLRLSRSPSRGRNLPILAYLAIQRTAIQGTLLRSWRPLTLSLGKGPGNVLVYLAQPMLFLAGRSQFSQQEIYSIGKYKDPVPGVFHAHGLRKRSRVGAIDCISCGRPGRGSTLPSGLCMVFGHIDEAGCAIAKQRPACKKR